MEHLRPVERRILALREQGHSFEEIGRRLRRSAGHIERVAAWSKIPRRGPAARRTPSARQLRILDLRSRGESYAQIGERFGRSGDFIKRVEGLAHYRLALQLLSD